MSRKSRGRRRGGDCEGVINIRAIENADWKAVDYEISWRALRWSDGNNFGYRSAGD